MSENQTQDANAERRRESATQSTWQSNDMAEFASRTLQEQHCDRIADSQAMRWDSVRILFRQTRPWLDCPRPIFIRRLPQPPESRNPLKCLSQTTAPIRRSPDSERLLGLRRVTGRG